MTPSVVTSVGSCVLATSDSVLGDEMVVGTDVDRVDTESDKECLVISDCMLALAVVVNTTAVRTDVDRAVDAAGDCVVIGDNVVGWLLVELSVVTAAVVGDVGNIAVEDVVAVVADLVVTADTVVTIEVVALADVVADKDVGVCVVERVALDSHTYRYKDEHP